VDLPLRRSFIDLQWVQAYAWPQKVNGKENFPCQTRPAR
jgi:hypothetical protein